jgi:glutamine amidotransferase
MKNVNKKIVIIDYNLGNLFSVNQALTNIGLNVTISSDATDINDADALVLPGVGAFGDAMKNLMNKNLVIPIKNSIETGKPFLGVCLGFQLLFNESEEFGFTKGLGILKGKVKRFNSVNMGGNSIKVPQIGWNRIDKCTGAIWNNTPLMDIKDGEYMYFVHSFYVMPEEDNCLSQTVYEGLTYISSIKKDNLFACQFHPEKSAKEGLKIYNTWAKINNLK